MFVRESVRRQSFASKTCIDPQSEMRSEGRKAIVAFSVAVVAGVSA